MLTPTGVTTDLELTDLQLSINQREKILKSRNALYDSFVNSNEAVTAEAWHRLGDDFRYYDYYIEAVSCYEHCLSKELDDSLIIKTAWLYERLNKLDSAKDILEKLKCRDTLQVNRIEARLAFRLGDFDSATQQLSDALETYSDAATAAANYEMAQYLESSGDHKKASVQLEEANRIKKQEIDQQSPDFKKTAHAYISSIKANKRWHENNPGSPTKCDSNFIDNQLNINSVSPLFIVGFPRSGTTLIDQILDSHPDVSVAEETPIFSSIFHPFVENDEGRHHMYGLSGEEKTAYTETFLKKLLQSSNTLDKNMRYIVDKFPLHIVNLDVIQNFYPQSKIIVMIRDPRDVLLSNYFQNYKINSAMYHCLDMSAAAELYRAVMGHYRTVGRKLGLQILEVRYENLVDNFICEVERVMDFLRLPMHDNQLEFYKHALGRNIKTPSNHQVVKPLYSNSVKRWSHYTQLIAPVMQTINPFIEEFGYK